MINLDELKKLQELRASGAITEEEFSQMKQSIISGKNTKLSTNKKNKLLEIILLSILTIIGLLVWKDLTDTSTVWDEWGEEVERNAEKVQQSLKEYEEYKKEYEKENMYPNTPNTQPVK